MIRLETLMRDLQSTRGRTMIYYKEACKGAYRLLRSIELKNSLISLNYLSSRWTKEKVYSNLKNALEYYCCFLLFVSVDDDEKKSGRVAVQKQSSKLKQVQT